MAHPTKSKAARHALPAAEASMEGLVVAAYGRHYLVEVELEGTLQLIQAFPRGKKSEVAVNDRVEVALAASDQAVINGIVPRQNLLYRSDQYKSKHLAANVDQVIIMLATEPGFSEDLLGRALVAAEALEIRPLILLNKLDLADRLAVARERLALYRGLGYAVQELSVHSAPEAALAALQPLVAGQSSILIGQSGMGKSSLLNLLVPDAAAHTREISEKLDSGKHTTTFTRLYHLPESWGQGGKLIDSPGFQEFGLHHLSEGMLERAFPEFRPHLGQCKFYNCSHLHEPGCAILAALEAGSVHEKRHALYAQLLHESRQQKPYQ